MLEVFIDRACALGREPRVRALGPITLDAADPSTVNRLAGGGILLVCARTSDGAPSLPSVRAIRRANPHVVIVLCAEWREAGRIPLARWTVAGVDEFVTFGEALDVAEVLRVVQVRLEAPPPAEELKLLRAGSPASRELDVVLYGLRNSCGSLHAANLAARFGYSLRSIREFLLAAGFPRPRDVCRIGRFLHMAELIERGVEAPHELARRLGFGDATEMRKVKSRLRRSVLRGSDGALGRFARRFPRLLATIGRPFAE